MARKGFLPIDDRAQFEVLVRLPEGSSVSAAELVGVSQRVMEAVFGAMGQVIPERMFAAPAGTRLAPFECDPDEASEPLPWYSALTAPDNGGRQYIDAVRDFNRTNSILMAYEWTHEQKSATPTCDTTTRFRRNRIDYMFTSGMETYPEPVQRLAAAGLDAHFQVTVGDNLGRIVVAERSGGREASVYLSRALAVGNSPRFDVVLRSGEALSADDLQDAVHRRFEYRLCPACHRSLVLLLYAPCLAL